MNLEEFELMTLMERLDALHRQGIYIGKSHKAGLITILMQLDAFYVEIHYLRYRSLVKRLDAFSTPEAIDEYLQPIDIDMENLAR